MGGAVGVPLSDAAERPLVVLCSRWPLRCVERAFARLCALEHGPEGGAALGAKPWVVDKARWFELFNAFDEPVEGAFPTVPLDLFDGFATRPEPVPHRADALAVLTLLTLLHAPARVPSARTAPARAPASASARASARLRPCRAGQREPEGRLA